MNDEVTVLKRPQVTAAACLFVVLNVECENYDRTVCTGPEALDGSGIMPVNAEQTGLMHLYAVQMVGRLRRRAAELGLTDRELVVGERFVQNMNYRRLQANYLAAVSIVGRLDT